MSLDLSTNPDLDSGTKFNSLNPNDAFENSNNLNNSFQDEAEKQEDMSYKVTSDGEEDRDHEFALPSRILSSSFMKSGLHSLELEQLAAPLTPVESNDEVFEETDPDMSSPFRELPSRSPLLTSTGNLRSINREKRRGMIKRATGSPTDSESEKNNSYEHEHDSYMDIPPPPVFEKTSPWRQKKMNSNKPSLLVANATLSTLNNSQINFGDAFLNSSLADETPSFNKLDIESIQKELTNCKIQLKLQNEMLRQKFGETTQLELTKAFEKKIQDNNEDYAQANSKRIRQLEIQLTMEKKNSTELRNQLNEFISAFEELEKNTNKLYEDKDLWDITTSSMISKLVLKIPDMDQDIRSKMEKLRSVPFSNAKLQAVASHIDQIVDQLLSAKVMTEQVQYDPKDNETNTLKETLDKERSKLKSTIVSLDSEVAINAELSASVDSFKKQMEQLKQEKLDVQGKLSEVQTKNSILTKEITELKEKHLEDVKTVSGVENMYKSELEKVTHERDDHVLKYNDIVKKLQDSENRLQQLEADNNDLNLKLRLDERGISSETEVQLRNQIADLNSDISKLMSKERAFNSEKSKRVSEFNKVKGDLIKEIDELRVDYDRLLANYNELDDHYNVIMSSNVGFSSNILEIFSNILDDASTKDTTRKVVQLANRDAFRNISLKSIEKTNNEVFEYHLLGTRTILDEYLRIAKIVSDNKRESIKSLTELEQKLYQLQLENNELKQFAQDSSETRRSLSNDPVTPKKIVPAENLESDGPMAQLGPDFVNSPRTRFRVEALSKRLKAAQEALAYEKRESKRANDELRRENNSLRELLHGAE